MGAEAAGLASLLFSVVLVCVVVIWVARAGAAGKLGRNESVGIRTRYTRVSDAAWQAGHAAALPLVNRTAGVAAVTVISAIAVQVAWSGSWGTLVGLGGISIEVGVLMLATRAANRAAQETS